MLDNNYFNIYLKLNVIKFLNLNEVFTLILISNNIKNFMFNEYIWKYVAYNIYGDLFWNKARNRIIKYSKPFISYYYELQRLGNFTKINPLYKNYQNFYKLWLIIDKKY